MSNLSSESKTYLDAFAQMPAMHTMEPQAVRDMLAQAPPVEVELSPVAKVEDKLIPVEDAEITVRIYTPEGNGPFPLFVYYHGGGWVIGDLETADASCRMIANKTSSVVVSVDYRLSPEYKFPVPFNDSYDALKWVHNNAKNLNGIASNITVGGDSAGGNLSAAVCLRSRYENGPKISAQILIYPVTNMTTDTGSHNEFQIGFGLDKNLMIWFIDHYMRDEVDKKNIYAAPLLAKDLSDLPPAFVIVAENDVLRDEGLAYAKNLQEAGVKVKTTTSKGLIHAYFTEMAVFPKQIENTISQIEKFLNEIKDQIKL